MDVVESARGSGFSRARISDVRLRRRRRRHLDLRRRGRLLRIALAAAAVEDEQADETDDDDRHRDDGDERAADQANGGDDCVARRRAVVALVGVLAVAGLGFGGRRRRRGRRDDDFRHRRHLERIAEGVGLLAVVERAGTFDSTETLALLSPHLDRLSSVVIVSLTDDDGRRRVTEEIRRRGVGCRNIVVGRDVSVRAIERDEVIELMQMVGYECTEQEVDDMIAEIDLDGNGDVDFEEFYYWYEAEMEKKQVKLDLQLKMTLFEKEASARAEAMAESKIFEVKQKAEVRCTKTANAALFLWLSLVSERPSSVLFLFSISTECIHAALSCLQRSMLMSHIRWQCLSNHRAMLWLWFGLCSGGRGGDEADAGGDERAHVKAKLLVR